MNKFMLLIIIFFIIGCDFEQPKHNIILKKERLSYDIICIHGVEYISGYRQLAPHFKPNGTLYICEENK